MSATSWSCRECTFRNKPGVANCEMCNNPRFRNNNSNATANAGGFASSAGPTGTAADFRPSTAAATTDMPFSMALDNPAPTRPPTVTSAPAAVSSVAASYPGRVGTHYSTTTTTNTTSSGGGGGDRAKIEALLEEQGAYVTVKNHPHRLHHVTSIRAWYCDFCRRQCNDWNVRYRSTNDKDKDSCDTCFNAGKAKDDHGQPFKLVSFTRDYARQKVSWYCDECGKANNGFRYRCDVSKDYDMCKDCVRKTIVLDGESSSSSSSGHSSSGGGGNTNAFASATASPPIVPAAAVPSPPATQPYVPSATPAPYVPSAASAQPYVPSAASAPSAPYVPGGQSTQPYVPSAPSAPYVATATTTPPPGPYLTATATVVPSPYVPGSGGGNAPYVPTVMASTTPPPGGVYVPPSGGAPYVPTATASTTPPPGGVYVPSSAPSPYVPGRRNP